MTTIKIYFDGALKTSTGQSGCGYLIEYDNIEFEGSYYMGLLYTINDAEYTGLLKAIEDLENNFGDRFPDTTEVIIRGDSKLVIEQISGRWSVNEYRLRVLRDKCLAIINKLKKIYNVTFKYEHISRELNSKADILSNQAISDNTPSDNTPSDTPSDNKSDNKL